MSDMYKSANRHIIGLPNYKTKWPGPWNFAIYSALLWTLRPCSTSHLYSGWWLWDKYLSFFVVSHYLVTKEKNTKTLFKEIIIWDKKNAYAWDNWGWPFYLQTCNIFQAKESIVSLEFLKTPCKKQHMPNILH